MDAAQAREHLAALDRQAAHFTTETGPGSRMAWRRWGEGPPLLLLHGAAGSWRHWVRNIEPLGRVRTVWAPDLPGFGDSDLPRPDMDADSVAPVVLAGTRELLGGERFDLVGFSFGSLVAGYLAGLASDTVQRLVLVAGAAIGVPGGPWRELRSLRKAAGHEREEVLRHNLEAMMIHDPARVDALAIAAQEAHVQRDRLRERKLARGDALQRLAPTWRCPAWGIWGRHETRLRDRATFDAAVARLGLRQVHVMDSGHWIQYEAAEAFNALLLEILSTRIP